MKKTKKKQNTGKIIIATTIICLIILLTTISNKILNKPNTNQIASLAETPIEEINYEPNVPKLSAGMIPVKWDGEDWIIKSKDDTDWYDYSQGKPAYIMLNDGTYQSEIQANMTNKKLASENIGVGVLADPTNTMGSIYMWIPRFAINGETKEVKYIPAEMQIENKWTIPDMFIYPIENEKKPDLSLGGIWVEKDINDNLINAVTQMNSEESIYGFIANNKARQITEDDTNKLQVYTNSITNTVGVEGLGDPILNDITNPNRIILQILNTNIVEPIKAKATYNEDQGKIEIQVTYSKNGIAKIIDEDGNTLSENSLTADTGNKELEEPTYSFTVIDNKGNKKELTVTGIIPGYYGKIVNNYTCPADEETDITWRVFHKDEEGRIYLIADDYVPYTSLPKSTAGTALNKGDNDYCAAYTDIIINKDYTGSAWIKENTNTNAQKWLSKYLTAFPDSTNYNMQAVAYMIDTNVWNKFVDNTYAEYAIGGPTLELFCASYKVTHPDRWIECDSVNENGYQIKWSDGAYTDRSVGGLTQNDFNKIYINSDLTKAYCMWLASPDALYSNTVRSIQSYGGYVHGNDYTHLNTKNTGFRPIVCLNSGTELQKKEDGTYDIISALEANISYDEIQEKINIEVTYSKYGIAKIIDEEGNILSENSLTAQKDVVEKGIYTFTVIDNKGNKKTLKIATIPAYYGAIVNNYTCPADEETNITWRVFHKDSENIYLIADDYIPYTSLPTSTAGTALNKGDNDYKAYFTNVLNDYTGSAWIKENTNENAQKWLSKYLTEYPASTNENMKAVAYMMDTDVWGKKFAGDKAEYAIGGPTIELFCASYKETHLDRYIECDYVDSNGYQIKWNDGEYKIGLMDLMQDDFNKIYINSDQTKTWGMWLASPSASQTDSILRAYYNGYMTLISYNSIYLGFRPIVCLNAGTELQKKDDGTYDIVSGAEASVMNNILTQPFEVEKILYTLGM